MKLKLNIVFFSYLAGYFGAMALHHVLVSLLLQKQAELEWTIYDWNLRSKETL